MCNRPTAGQSTLISEMDDSRRFGCSGRMSAIIPTTTKLMVPKAYLYRARNLVERFFSRIKHCRPVATRYDKLAANDLALIQLSSIRL